MKIVTVTGNIACGKSTLCRIIADEFKFVPIRADTIGHELFNDGHIIDQVVSEFPSVLVDGEIDRNILGSIIFKDESKRSILDSIMHPEIHLKINELLGSIGSNTSIVLEHPLVFELNMQTQYRPVILATCNNTLQLERLMTRNKLTVDDAMSRINSQMCQLEKIKEADLVVDTSIPLDLDHLSNFLDTYNLL